MEQLLGYIKNIGFFLILMSVVCNVLPDNSYKKYCRLFCGLVLVVLVINPFYEFLNYDGDIKDIFISNTYKAQLTELQNQLEIQEQSVDDKLMNQYEEALKNELSGLATEAGLYLMDLSVEFGEEADTGDLYLQKIMLKVTEDREVYDKTQEDENNSNDIVIEDINLDINLRDISDEIVDTDDSENNNKNNGSNPRVIQLIMSVADYLNIKENQIDVKMI